MRNSNIQLWMEIVMKRLLVISGVCLLLVIFFVLFFRVADASLELDDLKSGIDLRHREMMTLIVVTNASLDNCALSMDKLEHVIKNNGIAPSVQWVDDLLLLGNWRFIKNGKCVAKVELVGAM
jgi:hypothetical protein